MPLIQTDQVGIPRKPSPAVAKNILDEPIEYSKPFGTKITVENEVATIHIPPVQQGERRRTGDVPLDRASAAN